MSLTTVGLGVALLLAGPLSEVVGRTRLIHSSLTASAVVGLACAAETENVRENSGSSAWVL